MYVDKIIPITIATLVTLCYCAIVWYLGNLFVILTGSAGPEGISVLAAWAVLPLEISFRFNMVHWQLLALASLAYNLYRLRAGSPASGQGEQTPPLVNHYGLLLLLFFIHLLGFAAATISVIHVL